MIDKIEKIKCYLDTPEQMAKNEFSLFVALEEILHIRAGSNDRTLDRDIYEIFHQVFSFYIEPKSGTEIWTNENGDILKQAEVSFPSCSIIDSKIEIYEFLHNASNQNLQISTKIFWRFYYNGFIDVNSTDMKYLIWGFYEGKDADWDDFQKCLRGNFYGKETQLQRICNLYRKCDFPFSFKVKYTPFQIDDKSMNHLSKDKISATWSALKNKMISGRYEDYISLCEMKESPKNKLTWILKSSTNNGVAKGAFLELLEFIGYNKSDRKQIKKTAMSFFNLDIEPAVFDRPNSKYYEELQRIFQ